MPGKVCLGGAGARSDDSVIVWKRGGDTMANLEQVVRHASEKASVT